MVQLYDEMRKPRPHHLGSEYGFCVHCKKVVRGVLKNAGYEYGYAEDDVCPAHGDALQPAREESEEV
jgi:hypothetical protein